MRNCDGGIRCNHSNVEGKDHENYSSITIFLLNGKEINLPRVNDDGDRQHRDEMIDQLLSTKDEMVMIVDEEELIHYFIRRDQISHIKEKFG